MIKVFFVSAIFWSCYRITLSQAANLVSYGKCFSPQNESGLCIHISDCQYLFDILQSSSISDKDKAHLAQSQCGYDNTQTTPVRRVLVCCPDRYCKDDPGMIDPLATSPGNVLPEAGICGRVLSNRIFGGNVTQLDEFPWMALIEYMKPGNVRDHHCGGSLINSRYVLTAAHCVKGNMIPKSWEITRVRLGEWDLNTDPDCEIDVRGRRECAPPHMDIDVEQVLTHELYQPDSRDQFYDIALLRMAKRVTFSEFVKPICLPLAHELRNSNFMNVSLEVAGWGQTEILRSSTLKLKITVHTWPLTSCQQKYRSFEHVLNETQLCAGGEDKVDTCRGDSGGPLMVKELLGNSGIFFLAGIVSYGPTPCGVKDWPGVYTRVGSFIDWIQVNLKP